MNPEASPAAAITVSIVSHGHGAMITNLLSDLASRCGKDIDVVLTLNIPEPLQFERQGLPFLLTVIRNPAPKGFGANHNAALRDCRSEFFCILNPDIRLGENPFPALIGEMGNRGVALVAPRIVDPSGRVEDSARRFPTATILLRKLLGMTTTLDYAIDRAPLSADWVAGMFMLVRATAFREVHGFDEDYFLYYEDVDFCRRLRARAYDIRLVPAVSATHDARRESRRNLRHMRWHLASMLRYLLSR